VLPYENQFKIAVELNERPFPVHMVEPNGQIAVLVSLHNDVNANEAIALMSAQQVRVRGVQAGQFLQVVIGENDIQRLASMPFIKYIEPASAPGVPENLQSRTNHRINVLDAEYTTGLHYTGDSVAVGIGDDGQIGPHIDFKNRMVDHTNSNTGTHCDHVSGIVGGAGNFNPNTKGNASGSILHIYDDYDNLSNAATDYVNLGIRITSNSLGQGCNGGYNANAVTSDNIINGQTSLLSVHSAGNSGQSTCGGVGQGFYTITGGYKAGKNVLAVGNVQKDDVIAPSSSRGPAKDGRIKPEICAVGTDVESTQPNNTYDNFTGTSMACPAISGSLATLIEAYRKTHANVDPRSDVMKAILMNTADDLGNTGPDYTYGYGRINARRAYEAIKNDHFLIDSTDVFNTNEHYVTVPPGVKMLKVMLYWHDVVGSTFSTYPLVNNLDLRLKDDNSTVYQPWKLDHSQNAASLA
ncbi:MAG: peptidase S8, partial [Chitinophagaceae bacterium]|nr:peptidase S8 [Chitinophagaceae bacterium]